MEYPIIYANFLSDSIPFSLVELPIVEYLDLSRNQLGGDIPNTICANNSNLCILDFSDNIILNLYREKSVIVRAWSI